MKIWFMDKQAAESKKGHSEKNAKFEAKEISDDLMAQITGGAGKGACHTASLE